MSRTRKGIKYSGSLLAVVALCALGIWIFTPVSEEPNYKLDQVKNTIQINPETASANNSPVAKIAAQPDDQKPQAATNLAPLQTPEQSLALAGQPRATVDARHTKTTAPDDTPDTLETVQVKTGPPLASPDFPADISSLTPTPRSAESIEPGRVETFSIKSGDTLTQIFSRTRLPISQAIKLSQDPDADQLNRLSIGKIIRIYFDKNDQWETLEYDTDKLNTLIISPDKGDFIVTQHKKQVKFRTFTARGVINTALGIATENAGVSPGITQKLVNIYQWEIDFARDVRAGDTFSVVYQKAFIDDKEVADGDILAASFHSNGRTIDAIRYTDSAGITAYFQPDGSSLRRGFLRTPVRLGRITSGFGKRRHPIQKIWKKHLGVDYGARLGTPILATADGVVQYSGNKGGYGRAVILRHGGRYTTLYAHMSKFGKGVRSGKSVEQGQIIGYVGHSGWATGDHLHYEFRVNGQHKDPLTVKLPKPQPLAKKEMDSFTDQAEPLLGTLTSLRAAQLATLDTLELGPAL